MKKIKLLLLIICSLAMYGEMQAQTFTLKDASLHNFGWPEKSFSFTNWDNDSLPDIIIGGTSKLQWWEQTPNDPTEFIKQSGLWYGNFNQSAGEVTSALTVDVDNDNLMDIFYSHPSTKKILHREKYPTSNGAVLIDTMVGDYNPTSNCCNERVWIDYCDYDMDGRWDIYAIPQYEDEYHVLCARVKQQEYGSSAFNPSATQVLEIASSMQNVQGGIICPAIGDIDGDDDLEMLIGNYNTGNIILYEQKDPPTGGAWIDPIDNWLVTSNSDVRSMELCDIDENGKHDLLIKVNTYTQHWESDLVLVRMQRRYARFNNIDVGNNSAPICFDIDANGLQDLLVGSGTGEIHYFEQDEEDMDGFYPDGDMGIDAGSNACPAICDFDGDGLLDLLVGNAAGEIVHYEQDSLKGRSFTLVSGTFSYIDVGSNARPCISDLDGDGLLDLLIGRTVSTGDSTTMVHYEQISSNSNSFTLKTSTFNGIYHQKCTSPTMLDIDGDGLLDLFTPYLFQAPTYYDPVIYHIARYEQDAINSTSFSLVTMHFDRIAHNSINACSFFDYNNDDTPDMLLGHADGHIQQYKSNLNLDAGAEFASISTQDETAHTAVVNCNITVPDDATVLKKGFCYRINSNSIVPNMQDDSVHVITTTATTPMTATLEGLFAYKPYRVVPFMITTMGGYTGDWTVFQTDYGIPLVSTGEATDVSYTSASVSGIIDDWGGKWISARGICYSTSPNPTLADDYTNNGTADIDFTATLTGLTTNTTYYARAYYTNSEGTGYGNEVSFHTQKKPDVTTDAATAILNTSATFNGTVTDAGSSSVSERGFIWDTEPVPSSSQSSVVVGSGPGAFNHSATGLAQGKTYYVRAYATSTIGTGYGDQQSFATDDVPEVSTYNVDYVGTTDVQLNGEVTEDNGDAVSTRGFCWGTSHTPSLSDNVVNDATGGTGSYSVNLTGLSPYTKYYARAYATNAYGTSYGGNEMFHTASHNHNMLQLNSNYATTGLLIPETGTYEIWFYAESSTYEHIFSCQNWSVRIYDGDLELIIPSTTVIQEDIELEQWHHLAFSWVIDHGIPPYNTVPPSATAKVYLNGNLVVPAAVGVNNDPTGNTIKISSSGGPITGKMEECRIWSDERTQQEVRDNMYREMDLSDPANDNLELYYTFDHSSGTSITDHSGNGNTGTCINTSSDQWLVSTAPVGNLGVSVRTTNPTSVGTSGLTLALDPLSTVNNDNNLGIYSRGDGLTQVEEAGLPVQISQRPDIYWGIYEFGNVASDVVIDYSSASLTGTGQLCLLRREDASGDWENYTDSATHDAINQTFTVDSTNSYSEFTVAKRNIVVAVQTAGSCVDTYLNSYFIVGADPALALGNVMTIEGWVHMDGVGGRQPFYSTRSKNKAGSYQIEVIWEAGAGYKLAVTGPGIYVAQSNPSSSSFNWAHVAYTRSGPGMGTHRFYMDGEEMGLYEERDYDFVDCDDPIWLGRGDEYSLCGWMDELRVWSRVLSIQELRENMHTTLTGNEDGLVGYWQFNEGSGTVTSDLIAGNDGTAYDQNSIDWDPSDAPVPYESDGNGNWTTESTWLDKQAVPETEWARVKINSNVTLNQDMELLELEVASGKTLTVPAGNTLEVTDTINNLAGTTGIVLESSATDNANLIQESDGVDATVERYLTQSDYHYLSAPVNNQAISPEFVNTGSNPLPSTVDFYKFDEPNNLWRNIKDGNGYLNSSFETQFEVTRGYAYANSDAVYTKNFTGEVNHALHTATLDRTTGTGSEGWNLVGNPYPASVAANNAVDDYFNLITQNEDALDDNHEAIYLYDGNDYMAINHSSDASLIAPTQGFFVKAETDGAEFTFDPKLQTDAPSNFYKDGCQVQRFNIAVTGPEGDVNDVLIAFSYNGTLGMDKGYDAQKMKGNYNLALYSLLVDDDGNDYAIQTLPSGFDQQVKLGLDATNQGIYTFGNVETENMGGQTVYLEDKLTGMFINLNSTPEYAFSTPSGSFENRFVLHFGSIITDIDENLVPDPEFIFLCDGEHILLQNLTDELMSGTFHIHNLTGQVLEIDQVNVDAHSSEVHTPELAAGLYLVSFRSGDRVFTQKVVLSR